MNKGPFIYKFARALCIPIVKILFPCKFIGLENVQNINGNYIICSNHLSNIDVIFLVASQKSQICFMAKAELFKNKILKYLFNSLGAFSVDRGKDNGNAIRQAKKILNDGKILGIFIEGTRSKTGEFLRPRSGASVLACSCSVPVLPVCITGVKNGGIKIFKKSTVSFGNPIQIEELEVKNGDPSEYRKASRIIMSRIKSLRDPKNIISTEKSISI